MEGIGIAGFLNGPKFFDLTRIIHARIYCNRRSAAATSLQPAGSSLRPPRAALATRLRNFVPRLCSGP